MERRGSDLEREKDILALAKRLAEGVDSSQRILAGEPRGNVKNKQHPRNAVCSKGARPLLRNMNRMRDHANRNAGMAEDCPSSEAARHLDRVGMTQGFAPDVRDVFELPGPVRHKPFASQAPPAQFEQHEEEVGGIAVYGNGAWPQTRAHSLNGQQGHLRKPIDRVLKQVGVVHGNDIFSRVLVLAIVQASALAQGRRCRRNKPTTYSGPAGLAGAETPRPRLSRANQASNSSRRACGRLLQQDFRTRRSKGVSPPIHRQRRNHPNT